MLWNIYGSELVALNYVGIKLWQGAGYKVKLYKGEIKSIIRNFSLWRTKFGSTEINWMHAAWLYIILRYY